MVRKGRRNGRLRSKGINPSQDAERGGSRGIGPGEEWADIDETGEDVDPDAVEAMSPAQRHARFLREQERRKSVAGRFARTLPFDLDPFQTKALDELEKGKNVLVAAPTGAGKTVIADFAVFLARSKGSKAFYTTPIKALSNQKYHELVRMYGAENVGLLTGDISINSEAQIVVMTTEVLRNMLYERSSTLDSLRYVVLDEIHYLGDPFRGQVWEEVIIHLPRTVRIVGLSATVSNIEDFGAWIESVRGETALIVSEHRPVPLEQSVIVQPGPEKEPELYDLYRIDAEGDRPPSDRGRRRRAREQRLREQSAPRSQERDRARAVSSSRQLSLARSVNPELVARIRDLDAMAVRHSHGGGERHGRHGRTSRTDRAARRFYPSRWAVVDELDYLGLLPGIYFIFSRNGCERAVEQCIDAGLSLTSEAEARRIGEIADSMVADAMSVEDLKAMGYSSFRFALEHGFACHHAGMIALFREIVEKVFELGLVKVVFATETLALGINMPARSVIIEKLDKFNGTGRVALTPGEYTQLTGRAGRRGIDTLGHAVVVDHDGFEPTALAALSSRRVYPLHSRFSATFNMAVNLLNDYDPATARRTLDHSFAQWEANESAERMLSELQSMRETLEGFEGRLRCGHGNFKEFLLLREKLTNLERGERRRLKHTQFRTPLARRKAFQKLDDEIAATRQEERAHPCNQCPDLATHLRWGNRWLRARKRYGLLKDRYDSRTGIVSRRFDLICSVLSGMDYLEGGAATYRLTWRGQLLRCLFTEQDLLLAECLVEHVFDGLDAQQLAAVVSATVYESRMREESTRMPRHFPGGRKGRIAETARAMDEIWEELDYTVEEAGLDPLPQLDFGLVEQVFDWSADRPIGEVLDGTEIQPGDFVRTCKRLCDVLGQIRLAAPLVRSEAGDGSGAVVDEGSGTRQAQGREGRSALPSSASRLAETADKAYDIVNHGVVAYSGAASGPQPLSASHPETEDGEAGEDDWRVFD